MVGEPVEPLNTKLYTLNQQSQHPSLLTALLTSFSSIPGKTQRVQREDPRVVPQGAHTLPHRDALPYQEQILAIIAIIPIMPEAPDISTKSLKHFAFLHYFSTPSQLPTVNRQHSTRNPNILCKRPESKMNTLLYMS